jgi:adenosylcobinamide-GDP ribazoletransferase
LQAALILAAWVLMTGALHLDGLADSADAWLGAHGNRERALTIMKDPASGPAGVTAIILVLLIKFAALASLDQADVITALIAAPVLGRSAMTALFLTTTYVRRGGLGEAAAQNLSRRWALSSLLLVILVVAISGLRGIAAIVVSAILLWTLRRLMQRLLGGMTGDTLGAACEITEAGALVAIVLSVSAW